MLFEKGNSKELFRLMKSMMGYGGNIMPPLHSSLKELSHCFNIFFYDKINNIRTILQADSDSRCEYVSSQLVTSFEWKRLDKLARVEVAEVVVTINQLVTKSRELYRPFAYVAIKRVYWRYVSNNNYAFLLV